MLSATGTDSRQRRPQTDVALIAINNISRKRDIPSPWYPVGDWRLLSRSRSRRTFAVLTGWDYRAGWVFHIPATASRWRS